MKIAKLKIENSEKGFVALMSAIIISAVLLFIGTTLSLSGFSNRFNILDSEMKEMSSSLADACFDTAILNLAKNVTFTGDVNVGPNKCTIQSVTGGSTKTIVIQAKYKNYFTNLTVKVDSTTLAVVDWQELP